MALVSPTFIGMQRLVDVCHVAAMKEDLIFNPLKSSLLVLGKRKSAESGQILKMNNETVSNAKQVKYLGSLLRNDLKDDDDIMRVCRYVYALGNSLIKGFGMCSKGVKIKLFKVYMYQMYGVGIWARCKATTLRKLNVAYNTMFRKLLNIPRFKDGVNYSARGTFVSNRTHSFNERVRKSMYIIMIRLRTSDNTITKAITHYSDTPLYSPIYKNWRRSLYISYRDASCVMCCMLLATI